MALHITPVKLGVEIRGIDLISVSSCQTIADIKHLLTKHCLLIFKNQGKISGKDHVRISRWLGDLESTFYKHPRSPDPDVFRVSNDEREGCRNVGRSGWHIDGSFMEKPFDYALYHMVAVPKVGSTAFVGFAELLHSLSQERRTSWERLWMVGNDHDVIHPLTYAHPQTGQSVLCFHLGMIGAFIWDYKTSQQRMTNQAETRQILGEIHEEIVKKDGKLIYEHEWREGDFIISDNRAVAHEATPETQYPVSKVGLRILHRTTVAGSSIPTK
ncbi:alkylsulfatase-like [Physella acuta]|uniref:alkylsulfatase-like n=1 Tax=Physella acuta TaxID=109671 RepID=UPI0027DD9ED0|nr:alkylsulfatase-like [Physella acuta]XP_059151580.1 alkylsulfatase-like [Physella acuta]XP_059151581.1 alkylsulfatase-like [Physella acuta]XP_059151582.1 alkylsulfatase-like [Physella acuta]